MRLPFNKFAPAVQWRTEGLCLLFYTLNCQIKPQNLRVCLSTANKDNSKPSAEALKWIKNAFSAAEGGLKSRGSEALGPSGLEPAQRPSRLMLSWAVSTFANKVRPTISWTGLKSLQNGTSTRLGAETADARFVWYNLTPRWYNL